MIDDDKVKEYAVALTLAYAHESGITAHVQMAANMERAIKKVNELHDMMKSVD